MVGSLFVVCSSVVDSHTSPFLCVDGLNCKGNGALISQRNSIVKTQIYCSFTGSGRKCWLLPKAKKISRKQQKGRRSLVIVNELAGQYEDSFEDVKTQIVNYFTYKAVRTVLNQLYEMNPTQYRWFYDFILTNKPGDGKRFIRALVKEKQDLAERVMITRLHLYGKWVKKCDHAAMYKEISDQNLELMRERLMETVIWPSDDTNTEKIG
ncbi:chaperonin-like RbcX protein 2, chloroplastic [Rhododendron vialii]|uniref:chaperonin-like RbcX protein 2, chloroplastic n=1 Tax=Rhododendron vialii TaxID=182163 RepID=UPI00265FFC59|nr:chaperonin-like RbcX protein 2, chloroplastic [Rhododendron vialii]XP_058224412.1 chaperonin-like RbcX protein 2, chloroplastic [Rhododendron vialii]